MFKLKIISTALQLTFSKIIIVYQSIYIALFYKAEAMIFLTTRFKCSPLFRFWLF